MPSKAVQLDQSFPEENQRGKRTTVLYEVICTDTGGNETPDAYLEPESVFRTGSYPTGLPQRGTALLGYGLCTGGKVVKVISLGKLLVAVFFQSYGLFVGGPRPGSYGTGEEEPLDLPIWRLVTIGSFTYYRRVLSTEETAVHWRRMKLHRVERRWVGGNQFHLILKRIAENLGCWYELDGDYYLLSGKSSVEFDGSTQTRVDYVFETWARFPQIPANSIFRNAVTIPALGNLDKWDDDVNLTTTLLPPVISVVPKEAYAFPGAALPNLLPL